MKESKKAKDRGEITEESTKPFPEPESKSKKKWYDLVPYDKMWPLMPKLRYLRGSKAKIQFSIFESIDSMAQSIFECHKYFFGKRAQVDIMAYYIGVRIMEQVYLVQRNQRRSKMSLLLESLEKDYMLFDEMKHVKEEIKHLLAFFINGIISQEELDERVFKFIDVFETKDTRIKVARIVEQMMESGEVAKTKDRLRKKMEYEKKQEAKELGIYEVKNAE